jgi:hypothetical protein
MKGWHEELEEILVKRRAEEDAGLRGPHISIREHFAALISMIKTGAIVVLCAVVLVVLILV